MTDIDGRSPKKKKSQEAEQLGQTLVATGAVGETAGATQAAAGHTAARRKAATDTKNQAFVEAIRNRPPATDWLKVREGDSALAEEAWQARKTANLAIRALDKVPATYVYSGQKLQYTELKKAEQRARLKHERNVVFVRSQNDTFLSLVVPMVDTGRVEKDEALASKARWKTQRGFVYPAPRDPSEYNIHPQKPSESRVAELNEEWIENEMHAEDVGRVVDPTKFVTGGKDFDTIPCFPQEFGGYKRPGFEREYDGSHLGLRPV